MTTPTTETLVCVCSIDDLTMNRGAAALVGSEQVALFRIGAREVLGVQQLDPFCGAHVMARGIVGSRGDAVTISSPLHKQVFDLRTGRCLDPLGATPRDLRVWTVEVTNDNRVLVSTLPQDATLVAPAEGP